MANDTTKILGVDRATLQSSDAAVYARQLDDVRRLRAEAVAVKDPIATLSRRMDRMAEDHIRLRTYVDNLRDFVEFAATYSPATFQAYLDHKEVRAKLSAALQGPETPEAMTQAVVR